MQTILSHIIGWGGLIILVGLIAVFMSFFFNLSGHHINIRWVFLPCIALALFLIPKVNKLIKEKISQKKLNSQQ